MNVHHYRNMGATLAPVDAGAENDTRSGLTITDW